jgi:hypothetical protein
MTAWLQRRMTANGQRTALLLGGDLTALYLFAVIGRRSHGLDGENLLTAALLTALPFALAWTLVSPWFGMFEPPTWRALAQRLALSWPIALILGMLLRSWSNGTPLQLSFILVALFSGGALLTVWRMIARQLRGA